jgi:gliding motility-associated-like protein
VSFTRFGSVADLVNEHIPIVPPIYISNIEELFIYAPNTFTPNNICTNHVFLPIIDSGIDDATYNLQLFNRWGEMVFESKDKTVGWDGTYRGSIVQDGIFTWKITFKSPDNDKEYEYIGHVNLLK